MISGLKWWYVIWVHCFKVNMGNLNRCFFVITCHHLLCIKDLVFTFRQIMGVVVVISLIKKMRPIGSGLRMSVILSPYTVDWYITQCNVLLCRFESLEIKEYFPSFIWTVNEVSFYYRDRRSLHSVGQETMFLWEREKLRTTNIFVRYLYEVLCSGNHEVSVLYVFTFYANLSP